MATFRKRSKSWQARVQRKDYPDTSKSFKTYSEAVAWARKIEFELDTGVVTVTPETNLQATLKELLERYRKEVTSRKKHSSVESYRIASWIKHPLSNKPLNAIRSSDGFCPDIPDTSKKAHNEQGGVLWLQGNSTHPSTKWKQFDWHKQVA